MFRVRPVSVADKNIWLQQRSLLWPDGDDHADEIELFFKGQLPEPEAVLLVENQEHIILGFVELSIRYDIVGVETPTGYIEGLFVEPKYRNSGVAKILLQASKQWATAAGCRSFASDRLDRIIIDPNFYELQNH